MERKLPTVLAFIFIAITLARVGHFASAFMNAGALGWVFSVAMGAGVFSVSYWTRVSAASRNGDEDRRSIAVRRVALLTLIVFVALDGAYNLADVLLTLPDSSAAVLVFGVLYGIFPTIAAALLGALQGYVDRLPRPPRKASAAAALQQAIAARLQSIIANSYDDHAEDSSPALPQMEAAYECKRCAWDSLQAQADGKDAKMAYIAHSRVHSVVGKNGNGSNRVAEIGS